MAFVDTLNISSELNLTPARKRKRQFEKLQQQQVQQNADTTAATTSCFTNAAFSSTPKKILGKRRLHLNTNKENAHKFVSSLGLEVKSITDIAAKRNIEADECGSSSTPNNPYEVQRKPPKKKKRQAEEVACFENPALNLELPEKQFNPYEVIRDVAQSTRSNCFINPALNLKIQDAPASRNPFEIQREIPNEAEISNLKTQTNPVLQNPFEIPKEVIKEPIVNSPNPCNFKIGLPFVPTVGCRIDFKDLSMSQLTPSKLLAQKLIFSPVPRVKTSLGSIGEEASMDIGKELDQYQLELENSINEAKLRKNGIHHDIVNSPDDYNYQVQIVDIENKIKFTQKLKEISEDGENEEIVEESTEQTTHHVEVHIQKDHDNIEKEKNPFEYKIMQETNNIEQNEESLNENANKNPFESAEIQEDHTEEAQDTENLEELYGCAGNDLDGEDSFDFKTPAPFVRAYTQAEMPKLIVSRESLNDVNTSKEIPAEEQLKKHLNVKNMIRKSIRKLMHPHQHSQDTKSDEEDTKPDEKVENEKHHGIMNALRQSLRRKPSRHLLEEEEPENRECELSIIDGSERTMKFKSDLLQTEYAKIEDLTNEKKHSIRNSIRKSTRDMRNNFMKSVFHKKHEEYDFNK